MTAHVLRHSFASLANDLGYTEITIAALISNSKGTMTSKYVHTLDTTLLIAADTVAWYINGLPNGEAFRHTTYSLDERFCVGAVDMVSVDDQIAGVKCAGRQRSMNNLKQQ